MMADDLGWGDTGYNGNLIIKTPQLDAMSREGIRFNRFYAASSVCSPTRGACLTGRTRIATVSIPPTAVTCEIKRSVSQKSSRSMAMRPGISANGIWVRFRQTTPAKVRGAVLAKTTPPRA